MNRILFIPSTMTGGVYYYRVYTPMKALVDKYPNSYDIHIDNHWTFTDAEKDEIGKSFDIVWIHNCLYSPQFQDEVWKMIVYCKQEYGTKFVLDLDDLWIYYKEHPAYDACIFNGFPEKMQVNFKLFDYVTTTTEQFKDVISQYFPKERIYVFENAISLNDEQFTTEKNPSHLLRIGLTGGSSHTEDIKQMMDFAKYLTENQLKKIEFVFCGYDNRNAQNLTIDENGKVVERRKLDDKENWWVQMERHFKSQVKHYKRIESKDITKGEFGPIYKDIDVLLVPLKNNQFNRCKSELKFIEAGFTGTAVIASKTIPYSNFGTDGVDCLLVKDQNPESWAKAIKKLLTNDMLFNNIKNNNERRVKAERNLDIITEKRNEFVCYIKNVTH